MTVTSSVKPHNSLASTKKPRPRKSRDGWIDDDGWRRGSTVLWCRNIDHRIQILRGTYRIPPTYPRWVRFPKFPENCRNSSDNGRCGETCYMGTSKSDYYSSLIFQLNLLKFIHPIVLNQIIINHLHLYFIDFQ